MLCSDAWPWLSSSESPAALVNSLTRYLSTLRGALHFEWQHVGAAWVLVFVIMLTTFTDIILAPIFGSAENQLDDSRHSRFRAMIR